MRDGRVFDLQGGTTRYVRPDQVEAIAAAFASRSEADIVVSLRYDAPPRDPDRGARDGDIRADDWDDLRPYYLAMRAFYEATAAAGDAVIVSTC